MTLHINIFLPLAQVLYKILSGCGILLSFSVIAMKTIVFALVMVAVGKQISHIILFYSCQLLVSIYSDLYGSWGLMFNTNTVHANYLTRNYKKNWQRKISSIIKDIYKTRWWTFLMKLPVQMMKKSLGVLNANLTRSPGRRISPMMMIDAGVVQHLWLMNTGLCQLLTVTLREYESVFWLL